MHALTLLLLILLGVPLTCGGAWLLALGGSPFYAVSGVVVLIAAWGFYRRARWSVALYALWLLVLLVWALWEVGVYWWPLATRLGLPAIIGLLMALPAARRDVAGVRWFSAGWPVLGASLLAAMVAVVGIPRHLHETSGQLAMDVVNPSARLGDDSGAHAKGQWMAYGGTHYGQRFSPLTQITPANAHQLQVAWQIRTGDMRGPDDVGETTYQATPLKINDTLYLCTPHSLAIALDADSGQERWRFDPQAGLESGRQHQTCRGLTYYSGAATATAVALTTVASTSASDATSTGEQQSTAASAPPAGSCAQRLFLPTANAKLYALDATTGKPCTDFGKNGSIDLMHNMPSQQPGYYNPTSPPVIAGNKVIIGGSVNDNYAVKSPSGVIRAYDVHTGELLWNWDSGNATTTAPLDMNAPNQTYSASSPNSWSVFSVDMELGLVYIPMGNRTPDQLGMYRNADEEKYATSVVALDVGTGSVRWVQQFVHHDLWDMDSPAQPVLIDLDLAKGRTPALVVPTKQGDVYVLDRRDGSPLLPITERPAPQGTEIPGQTVAATQPASALSFEPPPLKESDMWGATLIDQMLCRIQFKQLRYEGRYTPPSLRGTIVYPGNFGTFNWGSVAVDPQRQVMFGMPTYLAFVSTLIPREQITDKQQLNLGEQGINENAGADYAVKMKPFLSPLGVPCQVPPWGTVAAADLRTGQIAYQYRNGTIRDLSPLPVPVRIGVPGIGGPLLTASGVAFLGAAVDNNFRAYDVASGKVLWDVRIPAGGQATPMSYLNRQGEQMVVLVAGGHGSIGTKAGDYVIAYKLPGGR
jgi:quinoprotein glucose dehydrogenase